MRWIPVKFLPSWYPTSSKLEPSWKLWIFAMYLVSTAHRDSNNFSVRTLIRPYMDYSTTIRMLFSKYVANIHSFQLGPSWNQVGRSWIPTWKKFGSIHRTIVTAIIYTIRTPTKSNSNYATIAFSVHQQYSEFPTWPSWNAPNLRN